MPPVCFRLGKPTGPPERSANTARGFTLIELIIGTTMSLAIAGVAMATLLTVQTTQLETQLKNATTRDAMYMLDMVGGDLGYAGVGVPWGNEVSGQPGSMRPVLRVATAQQLTFIGDLPLPNSDLNGLAVLSRLGGAGDSADVEVTSELSLCAPEAGALTYQCDTGHNSLFEFPSDNCSTDLSARTCPWALGKWAPINTVAGSTGGQLLLFTAPDGGWAWRRVEVSGGTFPTTVDLGETRGVTLQADFPVNNGEKLSRSRFLRPVIGASTISTLDRVFYSAETLAGADCTAAVSAAATAAGGSAGCVLMRRHCWGEVLDVDSAGFPGAGSAALTSRGAAPAGCAAPDEGTDWEPVANNLDSFTFRYFDVLDAPVAPTTAALLSTVASVEVELVIARTTTVTHTVLRHKVERRFFVEAGDGYGPTGRR